MLAASISALGLAAVASIGFENGADVVASIGYGEQSTSVGYGDQSTSVGYADKSTTSTVYTSSVYTITSCAPTVTDCPAKMGAVTTDVISLYETICPVTETESKSSYTASQTYSATITGGSYPTGSPYPTETAYSTETVYSTQEYTITSCPPAVTNCPVGKKTYSTYSTVTTYPVYPTYPASMESKTYPASSYPESESKTYPASTYPVETYPAGTSPASNQSATYPASKPTYPASGSVTAPVATYTPVGTYPVSSAPVISVITISTCVPSYYTSVVTVSSSAPVVTYPAKETASYPMGTGSPASYPASYPAGGSTGTGYPAKPYPTTTPFTGGAASVKAGGLMAAVVGLVAALL